MATSNLDGKMANEPRLEKARHIKYWLRCIKTLLPHYYTGNDSNRMYLAFFMVSALDLLDALTTTISSDEIQDYVNWIYRCQHPDGGFRMWPGTDFGERADETNAKWDPAHVPATYFALAALLVLGDDLSRVKRRQTLGWLRRMQRSDGSFGETFVDGKLEGGKDPRFAQCACGIRYILRGTRTGALIIDDESVEDVNVDALVQCIRAAEAFDGGIADEPFHEPHAGYTFCSIGALRFVDRLNVRSQPSPDANRAPSNPAEVIRWLVDRQTDFSEPDPTLDSEFLGSKRSAKISALEFATLSSNPPASHEHPSVDCAGMNGRTNKVADTCYAFWAGASLHMLDCRILYDRGALRKYLLEKTQNPLTGGFGKFPGDPPDLYHSYLGLAALSLTGSNEVKELDAGMCISKEAKGRLNAIWEGWGVES